MQTTLDISTILNKNGVFLVFPSGPATTEICYQNFCLESAPNPWELTTAQREAQAETQQRERAANSTNASSTSGNSF